jgi:hypothetical protein
MNQTVDPLKAWKSWSGKFDQNVFHYLSPINLSLMVYIMIQNSMIIYNYHTDLRKISSLLFVLIAAVDIGSAFFELGRGTVALLCLKNESMQISQWITVLSLELGLFCFTTSTFLTTVLTVVKTINIMNPFYRLNERALKISIYILPFIYLVLSISDIYLTIHALLDGDDYTCDSFTGTWYLFGTLNAIGFGTMFYLLFILYPVNFFTLMKYVELLAAIATSVRFLLPALITLVCMVLQITYIRKAFGESANTLENTANQANLTVFLISLLFFITVSLSSLTVLLCRFEIDFGPWTFESVSEFTLPLVNAALFPTILILRKPDLRGTYSNYLTKVLFIPVTVFNKVRHHVQRRRGYTDI